MKVFDIEVSADVTILAPFVMTMYQYWSDREYSPPLLWCLSHVCFGFILFVCILVSHELAHVWIAKRRDGVIKKIHLWAFGGYCHSDFVSWDSESQRLWSQLRVSIAGPLMNAVQLLVWVLVFCLTFPNADIWNVINPFEAIDSSDLSGFTNDPSDRASSFREHKTFSYARALLFSLIVDAINWNVHLFLFNMFLPVYPLDASLTLSTWLQIKYNTSQIQIATRLVYITVTSSVVYVALLGYGRWENWVWIGSLMFVSFYEGLMLKQAIDSNKLDDHPLFKNDRSETNSPIKE